MNFGKALKALKAGQRVQRRGWNGKGMFVYLVPANAYPAATPTAKAYYGEDGMVPYNAYFALKGVDDKISTWVPSINDTLAEDWESPDAPVSTFPPHQQRVIDERNELNLKLLNLTKFIEVPNPIFGSLPEAERMRLQHQAGAMAEYSNILDARIAAF